MADGFEIVAGDLKEVFGGEVEKLSAAKIEAGIVRLEELAAAAQRRFSALDRKIKGEAVKALGSEAGMKHLAELRTQAEPLRTRRDLLNDALEGARALLEQKRVVEVDTAVNNARGALEQALESRYDIAVKIEGHITAIAGLLHDLSQSGEAALTAARSRLSNSSALGFRLTGSTGTGFRPETAQHEVNMALSWIGGRYWMYDRMPNTRGLPSFSGLVHNWHAQLMNDFEERYRKDLPRLAGEAMDG
jgi:hypothetical protein